MKFQLAGDDDRRNAALGAASGSRRGAARPRWAALGAVRGWSAAVGFAAVSGGAWVAVAIHQAPEVRAVPRMAGDLDQDGLPDQLENVLGTLALRADSDLDGWTDVEELARGSHPMRRGSVPSGSDVGIAMDAYRDGASIHAITLVYLPDGVTSDKTLAFVTAQGDELWPVPLNWLAGGNPTKVFPGADGVGRTVVLDPKVSTDLVLGRNGFTLCGVVADAGVRVAADTLTLVVVNDQVFEQVAKQAPNGGHPGEAVPSGLGVGGVYRPLTHDPGEPSPGEICAQTTVVVGVINGIVLQEVAEADCVAGWDAYCAPGCDQLVGTQIKTIDPAALLGN